MARKVTLGYPRRLYRPKSRPQPKPFRFKVSPPVPLSRPDLGPEVTALALEEIQTIQDRPVNSKEEYFFYKGLRALGLPDYAIEYQVPWHGGRTLGGQVLDFVLTIGGQVIVVRLMDKHWHPGEYGTAKDAWAYSQLVSEGYLVKDLPTPSLTSVGDAIQLINRYMVL